MAWVTCRNAKANTRQGLLWFASRLEGESPGGKCAGFLNELLSNQGNEQFAIQPGLGADRVILGKVAQLGDLFEALEDQFDLPAQPVGFQNAGNGKFCFRERR